MNKLNGGIVCIMGKSGVGKSYIINQLINEFPDKFTYVKSYTTRGIRVDDPEDVKTHIFVNDCFWEDNKDKAIAVYHSPKGYTSWTDIDCFDKDKINLYAIDPKAVNDELYPFIKKNNIPFKLIYIDIPRYLREERYINREGSLRGFSEEEHLDVCNLNDIPKEEIHIISNGKDIMKFFKFSLAK